MKHSEKLQAKKLRKSGYSLAYIARRLGVAKSTVSIWVRDIKLSDQQLLRLRSNSYTSTAIEKRRMARLSNELKGRNKIINLAAKEINQLSLYELKLIGCMLYWAEGGKTQRIVRFSNGDPRMIATMMRFYREVCKVPETKFRGYIHIHPHLDTVIAEKFWSDQTDIPLSQFYKTYNKINKSSSNKKDTLPHGVLDIYILDVKLFLKIEGWASGIFMQNNS